MNTVRLNSALRVETGLNNALRVETVPSLSAHT